MQDMDPRLRAILDARPDARAFWQRGPDDYWRLYLAARRLRIEIARLILPVARPILRVLSGPWRFLAAGASLGLFAVFVIWAGGHIG